MVDAKLGLGVLGVEDFVAFREPRLGILDFVEELVEPALKSWLRASGELQRTMSVAVTTTTAEIDVPAGEPQLSWNRDGLAGEVLHRGPELFQSEFYIFLIRTSSSKKTKLN